MRARQPVSLLGFGLCYCFIERTVWEHVRTPNPFLPLDFALIYISFHIKHRATTYPIINPSLFLVPKSYSFSSTVFKYLHRHPKSTRSSILPLIFPADMRLTEKSMLIEVKVFLFLSICLCMGWSMCTWICVWVYLSESVNKLLKVRVGCKLKKTLKTKV